MLLPTRSARMWWDLVRGGDQGDGQRRRDGSWAETVVVGTGPDPGRCGDPLAEDSGMFGPTFGDPPARDLQLSRRLLLVNISVE